MNNFFKKFLISSFFLVFAANGSGLPIPPPPGGEKSNSPVEKAMYRLSLESKDDIENFRTAIVTKINGSEPLVKITEEQAISLLKSKDLEIALLTFLCLIDSDRPYLTLIMSCNDTQLSDYENKRKELPDLYKKFIALKSCKKYMNDNINFYLTDPNGKFFIKCLLGDIQDISKDLVTEFQKSLTTLTSEEFSISSFNNNYSKLAYSLIENVHKFLNKYLKKYCDSNKIDSGDIPIVKLIVDLINYPYLVQTTSSANVPPTSSTDTPSQTTPSASVPPTSSTDTPSQTTPSASVPPTSSTDTPSQTTSSANVTRTPLSSVNTNLVQVNLAELIRDAWKEVFLSGSVGEKQ